MLEVDDEKIIPLAKTESNLQNTSYDFEMEAFSLKTTYLLGKQTHADLMPMVRRSAIRSILVPIPTLFNHSS